MIKFFQLLECFY